ncbi:MAG: hypothetical protein LBJ18_01205, partial [Rickettsiales bacterium]|nr:hypothetical protein [Rickettsiales bacterium]
MKKLLINLISAPLKKRETRRRARCRLTLFFYATQLRRAFARFPELNDKIIVATNGGLADQLTFLFAIREFQNAGAQVVFNLTDMKTDLAQSARLYKYDEVAAAFGKTKREIVNDFATTPFELYKYKINWDGVLFANLPADFVDSVKID